MDEREKKEIAENLKRFLDMVDSQNIPEEFEQEARKLKFELDEENELGDNDTIQNKNNAQTQPKITEIDNSEEQLIANLYSKDEKEIPNTFYDIQKKRQKINKPSSHNPLEKYFRKPGVSIKLPSQGFYNENLKLLPTGEVTIYPLTAKDELWLKNPDAVLNGSAIVEVIKNCCPATKEENIFELVINDINAILMGIQRSTYGKNIEMKTLCSSCNKENIIKIDMDLVLSQIELLEDMYAYFTNADKLVAGSENIEKMPPDFVIFLEPARYGSLIPYTLVSFEESKIVQILENMEMDDSQKQQEIQKHLQRIHEINLQFISNSISYIMTPEGDIIKEREYINEYILNAPVTIYHKIEKHISYINSIGVPDKWYYTCVHCEKENETSIKYDPQNFL